MIVSIKSILNRSVINYLLIFFLVSFLISTFSSILSKMDGLAYNSYTWNELFVNLIIRYLSKFIFIFFAIVIVRFLFLKGFISNGIRIVLHFVFAITLAFYSVLVQVIVSNLFFGGKDEITWDYIYDSAIFGTDYNFFLYFCAISIVYAHYFFQKQKDFELKESNLKAQLLDSKINALQSQLQPHFLFNALNDISSLIDISTEKSQNAIADLSDLLRQTLALKDTKFITIGEELALLEKYLEIEKLRFQDKLRFSILVPKELLSKRMPPLILQPIVENAVKHGFSFRHDSLEIIIKITEVEQYIILEVSNNGNLLEANGISYGMGLQNIISRLRTLFEDDFIFNMENTANNKVKSSLKIPSNI